MLTFLLLSDRIFLGEVSNAGKLLEGDAPCPPVEEKQKVGILCHEFSQGWSSDTLKSYPLGMSRGDGNRTN